MLEQARSGGAGGWKTVQSVGLEATLPAPTVVHQMTTGEKWSVEHPDELQQRTPKFDRYRTQLALRVGQLIIDIERAGGSLTDSTPDELIQTVVTLLFFLQSAEPMMPITLALSR